MFSYTSKITITSNKNQTHPITVAHTYNPMSPSQSSTATMSPTAFTHQFTHLLAQISSSLDLCTTIPTTRRLGTTHHALDTLTSSLHTTTHSLTTEFSTLRALLGSRMDLGDDTARTALKTSIRAIEAVKARLSDIAYPQGKERREDNLPGFRELARRVEAIEYESSRAIEALGQRVRAEKAPRKREGDGEAGELERLRAMVRNSWVEMVRGGERCWVNVADEKVVVYIRPVEGFVKVEGKAKKVVRTPTWEQEQRQKERREDVWEDGRGW